MGSSLTTAGLLSYQWHASSSRIHFEEKPLENLFYCGLRPKIVSKTAFNYPYMKKDQRRTTEKKTASITVVKYSYYIKTSPVSCQPSLHKWIVPPFLLVEGLLSTGPTRLVFTLVRDGVTIKCFSSIHLLKTRPALCKKDTTIMIWKGPWI